ncbi:M50 family metallopeptidase [Nocardioides perillae]|uniref:Peptidase M50B-like n=1 Tax=Nocardioides perillae TaxID=1119534 RepID=A0A7Y9RV63_9ACTN|nr:hypothetical protein [Nocardioides perillae]
MLRDVLSRVAGDLVGTQPAPGPRAVLATALLAAVLVAWPPVWRRCRHALTIVHEAGHAAVAVLVGRRLAGIRLHADTSGLTVTRGRPRGAGMVATAAAGYPAPALVGLGAAHLLAAGRALAVLWLMVGLLAVVAVVVRNLYGLLVVVLAAAAVVGVTWWGREVVQSWSAWALTWFLLLGSPVAVLEMQRGRRRRARGRRGGTSDADVLARLTPLPALAWVGLLLLVTLVCLVWGARLLLP